MKRRQLIIAMGIVFALGVTGCGKNADTATVNETGNEQNTEAVEKETATEETSVVEESSEIIEEVKGLVPYEVPGYSEDEYSNISFFYGDMIFGYRDDKSVVKDDAGKVIFESSPGCIINLTDKEGISQGWYRDLDYEIEDPYFYTQYSSGDDFDDDVEYVIYDHDGSVLLSANNIQKFSIENEWYITDYPSDTIMYRFDGTPVHSEYELFDYIYDEIYARKKGTDNWEKIDRVTLEAVAAPNYNARYSELNDKYIQQVEYGKTTIVDKEYNKVVTINFDTNDKYVSTAVVANDGSDIVKVCQFSPDGDVFRYAILDLTNLDSSTYNLADIYQEIAAPEGELVSVEYSPEDYSRATIEYYDAENSDMVRKMGYIDLNTNEEIGSFDWCDEFKDGIAAVLDDGKFYLIDKDMNPICDAVEVGEQCKYCEYAGKGIYCLTGYTDENKYSVYYRYVE